jgi:hypothetical protein
VTTTDLHDRLFRRMTVSDTGCWLWTGAMTRAYGTLRTSGKTYYVHRVAYELWVAPIPAGYQIDHLCRTLACFRPDHLEAVTQHENIRRSETPWAKQHRDKRCLHGHELTADNVYVRDTGGVRCRTCHLEQGRDYRARRKAVT